MSVYGIYKTAALSPRVTVASPEKNADTALAMLHEAAAKGVGLAVLPELHLSAYTCADLFHQDALIHGCEKTEGETHILVDLQYRGNALIISVKDNGAGMSKVTLQQLQSRLDNCESEKNTEFQTSGIGLINIQKRIRFQFGSPYGITLSSEEGSGTTVTLSIPRSVKPC